MNRPIVQAVSAQFIYNNIYDNRAIKNVFMTR
jgi:hypothetical protein